MSTTPRFNPRSRVGPSTIKISGIPPSCPGDLDGHGTLPARHARRLSPHQGGKLFLLISPTPPGFLGEDRRDLVPEQGYSRATEPGLRALDLHLCGASPSTSTNRSAAVRYSNSNYQIEYSRNLVFEVGGADGTGFSRSSTQPCRLDLTTIKTILGDKASSEKIAGEQSARRMGKSREETTYDMPDLPSCMRQDASEDLYYPKANACLRIEAVAINTREGSNAAVRWTSFPRGVCD